MYTCRICKADNKVKDEMAVDSSRKSGLRNYCKTCHNEREVVKRQNPDRIQKNKDWVRDNPDKLKQYRLNKYNMTSEQYDDMLAAQHGLCKICSWLLSDDTRGTRPCVDHDHSCCSGKNSCGKCVRGIICDDCNTALGKFKDDVDTLRSAIKYLENVNVTSR